MKYRRKSIKLSQLSKPKVEEISLTIPSSLHYVGTVRSTIITAAEIAGFSSEAVCELGLAVTEICNNAIEYGSSKTNDLVDITCSIGDDRITVITRDRGTKNISYDHILADSHRPRIGRDNINRIHGLHLVKEMMDEFDISFNPGVGTLARLIKYK